MILWKINISFMVADYSRASINAIASRSNKHDLRSFAKQRTRYLDTSTSARSTGHVNLGVCKFKQNLETRMNQRVDSPKHIPSSQESNSRKLRYARL